MYPLETWKPPGHEGPPDQKAAALFSRNQGRTWGDLTAVADDTDGELVVFDAGAKATLGRTDHPNFLAEHMLIPFGKPGGILLPDGDLL